MKRIFVAIMASAFLAATTGLAMADDATPSAAPVKKEMKVKKAKKTKKHVSKKKRSAKKKKEEAQSTPAAK